jgi:hypothetical protein
MTTALKSIINEISNLTIEWTPKQKTKLNLFEDDPDPGLKINSFSSVCQYRMYLEKFYVTAKREIEEEISLILDSKLSIIKLEEYKFHLNENLQLYLPDNLNLILGRLIIKIPSFKRDARDLVLRQKVEFFVIELRQLINRLVEFTRHKIKIFKKLILPHEGQNVNSPSKPLQNKTKQESLFPIIEKTYPKLFWNKTDSDLLELVLALVESNAIITESGSVKQNMAIRFSEDLFNRRIKSAHIKIHKLGERMKDDTRFMMKLDKTLIARKQRLDQEKENRR